MTENISGFETETNWYTLKQVTGPWLDTTFIALFYVGTVKYFCQLKTSLLCNWVTKWKGQP